MTGVPGAGTILTGVAPHFAAATTPATGRADGNLQGNRRARAGLPARQADLGAERVDTSIRFDECMADPLDFVAHRGKVDCHFVRERACHVPIERARSLDCNPPIVDAPLFFHEPDRSVGVLWGDVN